MFHRMGSVLLLRRAVLAGLLGLLTLCFAENAEAVIHQDAYAMGYNHEGELGNGTVLDRSAPQAISGLPGLPAIVAVAAGASHSMALLADGRVYAWGLNADGQLGDGTTTNRLTAVQVALSDGTPLSHVIAISGGAGHSLALTDAGQVYAWGSNVSGQLGDGSTTNRLNPALISTINNIVAISAGSYHSLALTGNGKVYSWGYNSVGQLGDGTKKSKSAPAQIPDLTGVTAIAGGGYHSLALTGGAVFAWGGNNFGQLGDGSTTNRLIPTAVLMADSLALTGASAISAGIYHSVFLGGGIVYGVGYNGYGQLGDGTTVDRSLMVPAALVNVQTIAAGSYHTLAVLNHSLYAWGLNVNGQLGDGTTTNRSVPTAAATAYKGYAIAGGGSHTVFIDNILSVVSGALNFEGIASASNNQFVEFVFVPTGGGDAQTRLASIPPSGAFTISDIPQNSYTVWIKGAKYLAATAAVNVSGGNVFGLSVYQAAGDANNDNSTDSTDFGLLIGDYGSSAAISGSGYEESVDFNGDGLIDSSDFGLLIGEFGNGGAPLP